MSSGGGGGGQWSIERCPANFSAANSDIQVSREFRLRMGLKQPERDLKGLKGPRKGLEGPQKCLKGLRKALKALEKPKMS